MLELDVQLFALQAAGTPGSVGCAVATTTAESSTIDVKNFFMLLGLIYKKRLQFVLTGFQERMDGINRMMMVEASVRMWNLRSSEGSGHYIIATVIALNCNTEYIKWNRKNQVFLKGDWVRCD